MGVWLVAEKGFSFWLYVLLLLLLLLCVRRRNCLHLEAAGYFHHFEFAEI